MTVTSTTWGTDCGIGDVTFSGLGCGAAMHATAAESAQQGGESTTFDDEVHTPNDIAQALDAGHSPTPY